MIAETEALQGSEARELNLLKAIQACHRRWKYSIQQGCDDPTGCHNIFGYLQSNAEFVLKTYNVFESYDETLPHVIFIGKTENLSKAICYGGQVIGLDATFGITCYKTYSLFAMIGRCNGGAYPLGYFIASSKGETAVKEGLLLFQLAATEILQSRQLLPSEEKFSPMAVCIDTDDAENNAVRHVFPTATIILCHYHFMTNMVNEVRANRHGLSAENITSLMSIIRLLVSATTVSDFVLQLENMRNLSATFYNYFETNYLSERWISTFSEVNRQHMPLSVQRLCRSNMLTEVSFRTLKYIVFDGYVNKRLDYLMYSLCFKLYPYFKKRTEYISEKQGRPRFLVSIDVKNVGTMLHK